MTERCNFCNRSAGVICEKPYTIGEPRARITVTAKGTQGISLGSIDQCAIRQETLEKVGTPR